MRIRNSLGAMALMAALAMMIGSAAAYDESKYPDFNGQWRRASRVPSNRVGAAFDPTKPLLRLTFPQTTQQTEHCSAQLPMARAEYEAPISLCLFEYFDHPGTQGYAMISAALHTLGRNDPYLLTHVDIVPTSANYFVPPSYGQDQKFEAASSDALCRP